mgnify:CR=1 FL=1
MLVVIGRHGFGFFPVAVYRERLSVRSDTCIGFLVIEQEQAARVSFSESDFRREFIVLVGGRNHEQPSVCRCLAFGFDAHAILAEREAFGGVFLPKGPLQAELLAREVVGKFQSVFFRVLCRERTGVMPQLDPSVGRPFHRVYQCLPA